MRQHLALSYRLLDSLQVSLKHLIEVLQETYNVVYPQLNEGSCNHISVMAPSRAGPDNEVSA